MDDAMRKTKTSIGAIICRHTPTPQVFMVKCRVQFAYKEFVFGKYRYRDPQSVMDLLNNMTVGEKILIMSSDYAKMWEHIWLTVPTASTPGTIYQFYVACRTRFEQYISDGGRRLHAMIKKSKSVGDTSWTFIRGGQEPDEKELDCMYREIKEEGNIAPDNIRVLDIEPLSTSFSTSSCSYSSRYYIVEAAAPIAEGVSFENPQQHVEIADSRWVSLSDMNHMHLQNGDIKRLAARGLLLYKRSRK